MAKAIATGNPLIKKRVETENELERLKMTQRQRRQQLIQLQQIILETPEKLQQKIQEVGLEGIETNRAILNPECIRILKIEKIRTTPDNDFIPGSEELIFKR